MRKYIPVVLLSFIVALTLMIVVLAGCSSARKYALDEETGKMKLIEVYKTTGQKVEAKFDTGGSIKSDTGVKVPEFNKVTLEDN